VTTYRTFTSRCSDSTGVGLPCVALQSHRRTDKGAGVAAAESDAHHFFGQRLHDVAHQSRTRHAGVATRPADRARQNLELLNFKIP